MLLSKPKTIYDSYIFMFEDNDLKIWFTFYIFNVNFIIERLMIICFMFINYIFLNELKQN